MVQHSTERRTQGPAEELVRLPVGDGVAVYGKYRPREGAPVVVQVHGLTGHMDEALHYNAARRFSTEGFAALRFNFYGSQPDTRRLTAATVAQHVHDLHAVVGWVRARTPGVPVYVVGHSLGGLVSLLATEPVDGIVLWDAAHSDGLMSLRNLTYVDELGLCRWVQRIDHLLNPGMIDELRELDSDAIAARVRTPLLVIGADENGRSEFAERYVKHAGGAAELVVVPDSDHSFTRGETQAEVYDATVRWLRSR